MRPLESIAKKSDFRHKHSDSESPYKQVYQIEFHGDINPEFIEEPLFLKLSGNTPGFSTNRKESLSNIETNFVIEKRFKDGTKNEEIQAVPTLLLDDKAESVFSTLRNRETPSKSPDLCLPEITSTLFTLEKNASVKKLLF